MSNKDESDSLFKSKLYFNLGEATEDVSRAIGAKDTSITGAKLLGKTLFNTAVFAGKAGVEIAKRLPDALASKIERELKENPNIDSEKREKMEAYLEKHKNFKK